MHVLTSSLGLLLAAGCLLGPAGPGPVRAAEPAGPPAGDWPTEQVTLASGRQYRGLVESEDDNWVHLIEIQRPPARPMDLVVRTIDRQAVQSVVHLDPAARARLRDRVAGCLLRAEIERGAMKAVRLEEIPESGQVGYRYRGRWFDAECTTDEETTRRLIVRIEQIFAAYRCILAQRTRPDRPLRLRIFGSCDQYQAFLGQRGLEGTSRAAFFPGENLVVAGSHLGRFAAERENLTAEHQRLLSELTQLKDDLANRLQAVGEQLRRQGATRKQIRRVLTTEKRKAQELIHNKQMAIDRVERHNEQAFDQVARELLTRLDHEMFHAYLENYVYPRDRFHVPHWLNEGLAMVFESGRTKSGSLRLDAPHPRALEVLKRDLAGPQPLALRDVLASDSRDYLITRHETPQRSRRFYAYAWGLVYYLAFDRGILDPASLDRYLDEQAAAMPPTDRFQRWIGQSLADFEPAWRHYVRSLR